MKACLQEGRNTVNANKMFAWSAAKKINNKQTQISYVIELI